MKRTNGNLILLPLTGLLLVSLGTQDSKPKTISTGEAKKHVGETATVCGKVVGARTSKYAVTSKGHPTYLYLDAPEANPVFIVVTWQAAGAKSQRDTPDYQGKSVCAMGKITILRGIPQIIASEPGQLTVQSDGQK